MTSIRRDHKSTLFCHLFGTEERKGDALELYNALAGTTHGNPDALELTTIGDAIFLGMKNDVSFLVGDELSLWEHQSTHNPNMPLRGLHYFSRLYTKIVEARGLDIYGTKRVKLPTPRYVAFYFGEANRPEREVFTLSDSFAAGPGDLEVRATVLNCNEGSNRAIMGACSALAGYSRLVGLERRFRSGGMGFEAAARAAVERCIEEGALADYLSKHRAEVEDMLFTIQDEERAMRVHHEAIAREAREEGMAEGRASAQLEGIRALMSATGCGAIQALDTLGIPDDERPALVRALE